MRVTAVVCTYDRYDVIPQCLDSLANQKGVEIENFSVLIVDNTPNEQRKAIDTNSFENKFECQLICTDTPGLSQARNLAMRSLSQQTDVISYIDDDAVADEYWAKSIIQAFESKDHFSVIGGEVYPIWSSTSNESYEWIPQEFLWFLSIIAWPADDIRELRENEWLVGANFSIRLSDLPSHLSFNESLGRNAANKGLLSNEDNQFIDAVRDHGGIIGYSPKVKVGHIIPPERISKNWFVQRIVWQAISDYMSDSLSEMNYHEQCLRDLYEMPAEWRNILALSLPSKDPSIVLKQRDVLYNLIVSALQGFPDEK